LRLRGGVARFGEGNREEERLLAWIPLLMLFCMGIVLFMRVLLHGRGRNEALEENVYQYLARYCLGQHVGWCIYTAELIWQDAHMCEGEGEAYAISAGGMGFGVG
jgi:hypothetical protein